MAMDTTKHRLPLLFQNISLHTSGQDIDSFHFAQNIGLHTSGQDTDFFHFA